MIRVADHIAQALVAGGITDVFLVTGGGPMARTTKWRRRGVKPGAILWSSSEVSA